MFFIIREIAGWTFVAFGITLVIMGMQFLDERQVIEAGISVGAASLVFRGGIHLMKASTAARVVMASRVIREKSAKN